MTSLDLKIVFAVVSSIVQIIGFYPYFKDIFSRKTKPHLYTWLIWSITLGTATVASWYGGGRWAALGMAMGTFLVFLVFLISFKYGTKDIKKIDTFVLVMALLAVVLWWQLKNPLLAVLMVSAIDGLGYIPTIRKSFKDPWSETILFWLAMTTADIFTLLAITNYNLLTVTYITTIASANLIIVCMCIIRRNIIRNKNYGS